MRMLFRTALLCGCGLLGAASLALHAQGPGEPAGTLPEGPGKALVAARCVGCHALEVALGKRGTADDWRATVQAMVDRGAPITNQDAAAIASYLGQYFGSEAPAAGASGTAQSTSTLALPEGPGKDVLTRKCFQCHTMSMWSTLRQDRRAWEGVLYRMVGRGALWTEDEIGAMAEYLARVAGPAPAGRR